MAGELAPRPAGTWAYLKEAFGFRWNLLLLVGGAAAAILSPFPDIALPLVGAVELAYLAGLTSIPRFRSAIDAKAHAERKQISGTGTAAAAAAGKRSLAQMLTGLNPGAAARFVKLRDRCLDMRHIAKGVSGQTGGGEGDDIRTPALDKLLWIFLRLLHSQQALQTFLAATDEDEIKRGLAASKAKLDKAAARGDERIVTSLTGSIANAEMRLENYRRAESNAEFVEVELERVEGQIKALTEMTVSNQDPDYISSQVSSVAKSMGNMEETIRELNQITGMAEDLEGPPSILESDLEVVEA